MPPIPQQVQLTPEQIAAFQADPNQWMQQVLEGQYLGANPYIDELIRQTEADAMRQFQESILPTRAAELNLSGAYGTALGQQAEANTARDFAQMLSGQTSGLRAQDYASERDRMMQALQLLSGETLGTRQGLFGARGQDVQSATNLQQAQIAANAQRAAARAAAGASRYGADRSFAAARLGQQANFWQDAFNRSGLMRGFTGGPQQSLGQRGAIQTPSAPTGQFAGLMQQGVFGGPAGGVVQGPSTIDPWNNPQGLF